MSQRKRFQPLSMELVGYIKTFVAIWIIFWVAIFLIAGVDKWAFFAGFGLGFIFTIPCYLLILWLTGVEGQV